MNTYKKEKTRGYVAAYRKKKEAMGWKYITLLIPPDIKDRLMTYKHVLMSEIPR